jgi:hypothetical protein
MDKTSKSGTSVQTVDLSPEQRQSLQLSNELFGGTIAPTYKQAVTGATDLYNRSSPGITNAAQNLAGTANQAQNVLGTTGESALKTGISGLENLFSPEYEQQQLAAVLQPAQAQYQQNLAGQMNQFGGAGQLGSARSALAQTQLAGTTQAQQQQAAAQVANQIAQQRMQAGQSLAGIGQAGIGQGIGAAQTGVNASTVGMDTYNKYLSGIFGTPSTSYGLGPVGSSTNTSQTGYGFHL